ncbi:MAG: histidine kinase dimerization/phospho-acceptor domain-containing protein, partial [Cyanobacteria bacterium P01_A01_bin.70]
MHERIKNPAEDAEHSGRFDAITEGPLEVKRPSRRFASLFEGMSRALETRASFVANTSHELRTPLNAILGYAEFLAHETPSSEELDEGLQSIHSSGTHLLGLINDILDFSKIDADQMTVDRIPVDLRELLDQVRVILAGKADDKGIELMIEVAEEVPKQLSLDPVRVRQMVLNVAGNALKFTDEGSVRI